MQVRLGVPCEFFPGKLVGLAASVRRSMRAHAIGAFWGLKWAFCALVSRVLACTFNASVGERAKVFGVPEFLAALALGEQRTLGFNNDFLKAKVGDFKYFLVVVRFSNVCNEAMIRLACVVVYNCIDELDCESQFRQFCSDPFSWCVLIEVTYEDLTATIIASLVSVHGYSNRAEEVYQLTVGSMVFEEDFASAMS